MRFFVGLEFNPEGFGLLHSDAAVDPVFQFELIKQWNHHVLKWKNALDQLNHTQMLFDLLPHSNNLVASVPSAADPQSLQQFINLEGDELEDVEGLVVGLGRKKLVADWHFIVGLDIGLDEVKHDNSETSYASKVGKNHCQLLVAPLEEVK